jgi:hypothetical protein
VRRNVHTWLPTVTLLALCVLPAACEVHEPLYVDPPSSEATPDSEPLACEPPEEQAMRPSLPSEYADMCQPHVGQVPTVDCGAGVPISVYVDGVEVFEDPGPDNCDNPRAGQCTPGSSLQRLEGQEADGTPLPEVVWVALCRHDNQVAESEDGEETEVVEDHVQLIGHNTETGATCFFGRGDNAAWTSIEEGRMVGVLPGPDEEGFDTAFTVPDEKVCVGCHQANPYIHTSWTDSARLEGSDEPVVPVVVGTESPYYVVGAPEWDMRTLYIEGNGCLDCHRVGMETVRLLAEDPWYVEAEMPPGSPGSMAADFEALASCWLEGPENTPGCDWVLAPAGGCELRVAGEDYPNAGEDYNQGGELPAYPPER